MSSKTAPSARRTHIGFGSVPVLIGQAVLVSGVVIVVCIAFQFSVPYAIRLLDRSRRRSPGVWVPGSG